MPAEIKIPIISKTDRDGNEYYITAKVEKSVTVDLADWIGFIWPPEPGENAGQLVLQPRKSKEELDEEKRKNSRRHQHRD